jgi:putative membrane protein
MLDPDATRRRDAHFARANEIGHHRAYDYASWTDTTLAVGLRARAVNNFRWPWALVNGVAIVWCALARNVDALNVDLTAFERAYALIFSLLAFLLVFRVNRAAVRWWDCRTAWGAIVLGGRLLADDAIATLRDACPSHVDDLVRWHVAFAVATKCHLRRERAIDPASLAGVIGEDELEAMRMRATHAPLYCASRMRDAVTRMTREPSSTREEEEHDARLRWERARMHWSLAAALNARMTSRYQSIAPLPVRDRSIPVGAARAVPRGRFTSSVTLRASARASSPSFPSFPRGRYIDALARRVGQTDRRATDPRAALDRFAGHL